MPVIITASVSKKVGQANYGSAGYSLTVQSEVTNLDQVQEASSMLYQLLNDSVNKELGTETAPKNSEWPVLQRNTVPQQNGTGNGSNGNSAWKCSEKQKDLILKLMEDHNLKKNDLQSLANEMFAVDQVSSLNKLQASGLIDRLIEQHGGKSTRRGTTPARFNGRSGK
jgi:hypothetical protein